VTALHLHHLDGRLGRGLGYVDDDLVVALTPADHRLLHLLLDDLGLRFPPTSEPLLLHRARRHAVTCGWAADAGRTLVFDAGAARALQALWLDVVAALEVQQTASGWPGTILRSVLDRGQS
jgi:hypothetical protein